MRSETSFDYRSRAFLVLMGVNFLLYFSGSLLTAPTPYLIETFFVGSSIEQQTMEAYGILLSLGYIAITLGYFFGGFAADRIGRRTTVVVSFALFAVGATFFSIGSSLSLILLGKFVQQFGFGFCTPIISCLVADYSAQHSRGTAFGIFNLSWVIAQVPATILGGLLVNLISLKTPFIFSATVALAGVFFSLMIKSNRPGKSAESEACGKITVAKVQLDSQYRRTVLVYGLANLANGVLNGFLGPLLTGILIFRLGAAALDYGTVMAVSMTLVTGIVQIPGGKLADRVGRKPLVLFSFLGAPLVLLLAYCRTIVDFGLVMASIGAVGNLSAPAVSAWLMDLVPEKRRPTASGLTQTFSGVGLAVGPNAGSVVWNAFKPDAFAPCGIAALIFVSAIPFYVALPETRFSAETGVDGSMAKVSG